MTQPSDPAGEGVLGLLRPSALAVPERLSDAPSGQGHIPFAFLLVDLLRPRTIAELGTNRGDVYCALCQAVSLLRTDTRCHGFGAWTDGPDTAGGTAMLDELKAHHDPRYASFSTLLTSGANDAADRFEDGTIDLLVVGEAASSGTENLDLVRWRRKLSDRAVILLRGALVRREEAGPDSPWDDLKTAHPYREFGHDGGLGLLALGSDLPPAMARLFALSDEEWSQVARLFERLGTGCSAAGRDVPLARVPEKAATPVADGEALQAEIASLRARVASSMAEAATVRRDLDHVRTSVSWRITQPLRSFVSRSPGAARLARRMVKLGYWTMSGTLVPRIRASIAHRIDARRAPSRRLPGAASADPSQISGLLRDYLVWRWPDRPTQDIRDLYGFLARWEKQPLASLRTAPDDVADRIALLARLSAEARRPGEPDVSVILPVHNALAHTLACLHSLLISGPRASFEVIVADDLSSDATPEAVAAIGGVVRLVRQTTNLGFLRNCNAAARTARGRSIAFLNNDTIVLPGWLDELVAPLADEGVGLTCSKLLNTDGSLQEAGGIVWADGSAWNYGRGKDPRDHAFNFVRDTDYGSGAAIAVRRAVWTELGGFDETFAPAYCEDADLAFRLRRAGYRTLYTPFSEVIHHEGVSHGRDERVGIKAYQVANLATLKARWATELEERHRPSGTSVPIAAARSGGKVRILVVDHDIPQPDRDAGSRAMHGYLRFLVDSGLQVAFWSMNRTTDRAYRATYQRWGVEVVYDEGLTLTFPRWWAQRGDEFHYVFLSRPSVAAPLLRALRRRSKAKLLFFGHDIHTLRLSAEYEVRPSPALKADIAAIERQERKVWTSVDAIYYPSQSEADHIARLGIRAPARALPLFMFDEGEIVSLYDPARHDGSPTPTVTFVGGFAHGPNVDGILWFHTEIWPRIKAAVPGAVLVVAGSNPPLGVLALTGADVMVTGHVSDAVLADLYRQSTVSVAPLRFGAGVKGKVVEALRFGIPLVTTGTGAQGIPDIETACDVTDDPATFAAAVIRLLSDPQARRHRSLAGHALVRRHFTVGAVRSVLARDIPELAAGT